MVTAETCTGGLVAASLSLVKGAGEILHGSIVTYTKANEAKALGVLRKEGAVTRAGAFGAIVPQVIRAGGRNWMRKDAKAKSTRQNDPRGSFEPDGETGRKS